MTSDSALREVFSEFLRRHGAEESRLTIPSKDIWKLDIRCDLAAFPGFCIRSLNRDDVPALQSFGDKLGPGARHLFAPYPWAEPDQLPDAFRKAIDNAVRRVDASYLMEVKDKGAIGHFFLWKAGGNAHSRKHGVQVPELGVAIGDEWQRKGLGQLAVRLLNAVARELRADAVELTTAMTNEGGWNTYRGCGYEFTGIIRNPLDVDVAAVTNGEVKATRFRDERQLVYVIDETKRRQVLDYLTLKREEVARL
jgi:RimJ/RimL family protein N-acetyltransferase